MVTCMKDSIRKIIPSLIDPLLQKGYNKIQISDAIHELVVLSQKKIATRTDVLEKNILSLAFSLLDQLCMDFLPN